MNYLKRALVALAFLSLVAASSKKYDFKCNPALHCPPDAVECIQCNPLDHRCKGKSIEEQSPGVCSDRYRPTCKKKPKKGCPCLEYDDFKRLKKGVLMKRCHQVWDNDIEMRKQGIKENKQLQYEYISACREGEYTCFNGYCSKDLTGCKNTCKDFCKIDPTRRPTLCRKKGSGFPNCKNPLLTVRYGKERCSAEVGDTRTKGQPMCMRVSDPVSNFLIDPPSPPQIDFNFVRQEVEDRDFCPVCNGTNTAINIDRVMNETVTLTSIEVMPEHCCANKLTGIDFLSAGNMSTSYSNSFIQEAQIVNNREYNIGTTILDRMPEDSVEVIPMPGLRIDYNRESILKSLSLKPTFSAIGSESSCCCSLKCTAHGDPHLTAFDGTQASSYLEFKSVDGNNSGLLLYEEDGFQFWIASQGYRGLVTEIKIVLPDVELNAADLPNGIEFYQTIEEAFTNTFRLFKNGEEMEMSPLINNDERLPVALRANFETYQTTCSPLETVDSSRRRLGDGVQVARKRTNGGTSNRFKKVKVKSSSAQNSLRRQLNVKKCPVRNGGDFMFDRMARFDIEVYRPVGLRENGVGCSALPLLDELLTGPGNAERRGFCFGPSKWDDEIREYFSEQKEAGVFETIKEAEKRRKLVVAAPGYYPTDHEEDADYEEIDYEEDAEPETEEEKEYEDTMEACSKLIAIRMSQINQASDEMTWSMEECMHDAMDFGHDYIVSMIEQVQLDALEQECIDANDILTDCDMEFNRADTCLSGLTLEAKRKGTNDDFAFVRFFPAYKRYCDDLISIDLERLTFKYPKGGEDTLLDLKAFDIRVVDKIDGGLATCDPCEPRQQLRKLEFKIEYEIELSYSAATDYNCQEIAEEVVDFSNNNRLRL